MNGKRGQGLSTDAIILIILGVIILVIFAIGFTVGWGKIAPWISTTNVDTIVQQCGVSCDAGNKYDYCNVERELKDSEGNKSKETCAEFATLERYQQYNIQKCAAITNCNQVNCTLYVPSWDATKKATESATCNVDSYTDITALVAVKTTGNKCCLAK